MTYDLGDVVLFAKFKNLTFFFCTLKYTFRFTEIFIFLCKLYGYIDMQSSIACPVNHYELGWRH